MGELSTVIRQSIGKEPADLVIRRLRIFNLFTGELQPGEIAICGDTIVGCGPEHYEGKAVFDGNHLIAVPGFVDSHVHIESSMLTPPQYQRLVLPLGTTTAICDPHEFANVCGTAAFDYFLACADAMLLDLQVQLSSCVPATPLEESGARLDAAALLPYRDRPHVLGLGEFMNYPGIFQCEPTVLEKLRLFDGRTIDGHAPLLSGKELNTCLAAGVVNCHETTTLAEGREKLAKGMQLLIRDGGLARDLETLTPLITLTNSMSLGFCSDDLNPELIEQRGHIDGIIRRAIAGGADVLAVYRAASLAPCRAFGLHRRGALAPGYRADLLLIDDLNTCHVKHVFQAGREVTAQRLDASAAACPPVSRFTDSIRRRSVTPEHFRCTATAHQLPVIGLRHNQLITDFLLEAVPVSADGDRVAEPENDLLKAAVISRYHESGHTGVGFVRGFGLKRGALASSIGHDSHNLCVIGVDNRDLAAAVNTVIAMHGGFALVEDGKVLAQLPLPVGGLMSDLPGDALREQLHRFHAELLRVLPDNPEPLQQLAFLALPVIPFLKLTTRGPVDVTAFRTISLHSD